MDLDRGVLARIDRRLLAELDRDERFQMVRVPVTPAKWSTWKRYCDAAGISMGRAIAALIDHELASMFGDSSGGAVSMFEEQAQRRLADREAALTKRGNELSAAEERVRRWSQHLRGREHEIEVREWRGGSDETAVSSRRCPHQDRSQRTLPVWVGPQAQAMPRPAGSVAGRAPGYCLAAPVISDRGCVGCARSHGAVSDLSGRAAEPAHWPIGHGSEMAEPPRFGGFCLLTRPLWASYCS